MTALRNTVKTIVALVLCVTCCFAFSTTAHASTWYTNHYTGGSSGSFQITTTGSIFEFTVQTQGFSSSDVIVVEVYDSTGTTMVSQSYVWLNGNQKIENQPLKFVYPAGTYTIKYDNYFGGSGWIGVWLY